MNVVLRYTLCFVQRDQHLLMLNRIKAPNLGLWNGVGGKIEPNESPLACARREIYEETGIADEAYTLSYRGIVTWRSFTGDPGGMHIYVAKVASDFVYPTPIKVTEGILDWKPIAWIAEQHNFGIAEVVPRILPHILTDARPVEHAFTFTAEPSWRSTYTTRPLHDGQPVG
jgi:8-oxo-dGTP diphosphatase